MRDRRNPPRLVGLPAARCAELAAPAITRTFVSGMRSARRRGAQLIDAYGRESIGYLIDLRNPLAAGMVLTFDDLAAIYPYEDASTLRTTVAASVTGGLLDDGGDRKLCAGERGRRFLDELFAVHAHTLATHGDRHLIELLVPLVGRLLEAAAATAGPALTAHGPPYEPDGAPPGVVLLNRLSTLRYHRLDAHVAAWRAAGWTAAQVQAMPSGTDCDDERRAIEHDTNVRNAPPFAALAPDDRLTFLGALAALA